MLFNNINIIFANNLSYQYRAKTCKESRLLYGRSVKYLFCSIFLVFVLIRQQKSVRLTYIADNKIQPGKRQTDVCQDLFTYTHSYQ